MLQGYLSECRLSYYVWIDDFVLGDDCLRRFRSFYLTCTHFQGLAYLHDLVTLRTVIVAHKLTAFLAQDLVKECVSSFTVFSVLHYSFDKIITVLDQLSTDFNQIFQNPKKINPAN